MFNINKTTPPKVSLTKKYETISKSNNNIIEQQDNDSINTMDYYKEEYSSKTKILEEKKIIEKNLNKIPSNINSKIINDNQHIKVIFNKKNGIKKSRGLYNGIKFKVNSPVLTNKIGKNFQKNFEDKKGNSNYCCRCNSKIEYAAKVCPHCLKPFCKKCLKEIFNRNLDNNEEQDNFDHNLLNEKKCPNCRNLASLNDFFILKSNNKNKTVNLTSNQFDSESDNNNCLTSRNKKESNKTLKDLEEQSKDYNLFLKKIEEKKKELEIRKNLNINILQMLQKSIEYEYNLNISKLNQISSKLQTIQKVLTDKWNKISQNKNFNNDNELQNLFFKFKKALNSISQNYEIFNKKIELKSRPKTYKVYESKSLLLYSEDTYCMKNTEILSNPQVGNVYIKVERFVNGYVNCLNFAVSIFQENKKSGNNNKSKFAVHLVVDNKLIKLNRADKDNNNLYLNYDCSLEESQVFMEKSYSNGSNNLIKKDNFNVRVFITELFL